MSNKGNAYVLAIALYARDKSLPLEDMAENLYHCVDVLEYGEDERKADLYAQLAESLADGMTLEHVVSAIEVAMDSTDRRLPRG